ncbi:hypothetical protein PAECIP112173_01607 [Paenibacillus sp. JJ-100]|uniref:hypothetical protein n=1 Tax=Paenibacillus sp. JJ-100 TaxID=2974896 RepID=UPI0022FF8F73|nr:hypothetical protein [Paenibacillus sp. JJ-100]CAI6056433.1 hypothetical protein PAECIP112173_01607 [Paenibacillus sp. JJ-100]
MKKFFSMTAAITSMTLLLSSAPAVLAASPSSSTVQEVQNTLNLDQKVTKKLTDAITAVAGKQTIQFTSADTAFDDNWIINATLTGTAEADVSLHYDSKKGIVTSTMISYKADDLDKIMGQALSKKVDSFLKSFDKDNKFETEAFWRVKQDVNDGGLKNYWVIWGPKQSLYIDVDRNNQISASIQYKIKDTQAALTNKARNSLKTLGISELKSFDYANLTQKDKDTLWKYQDDSDLNYVLIGSKSGKVWKVANELGKDWNNDVDFKKSFAKPKLTKSKALSVAAPKVKSIFGLQLKGYSVDIKDNEYTFKKKGAATLIGKINKKGAFYSFEAFSANGVRN